MKYTRHIYLALMLVAATSMVSCMKVTNYAELHANDEIVWNVVCTTPSTKSVSSLGTDSDFATCVWELPKGKSWASNKSEATLVDRGSASGISGTTGTVRFSSGAWMLDSAKKLLWPEPEVGSLSFLSFTANDISSSGVFSLSKLNDDERSKISVTKDGLRVNDWNTDNSKTKDILVAPFQTDKSASAIYPFVTSGVTTDFQHIFARFKIVVQKSDQSIHYTDGNPENTEIKLKSVKLLNYWKKGSFQNGGTASKTWSIASASSSNITETNTLFSGDEVLNPENSKKYDGFYIPQLLFDSSRKYHEYYYEHDCSETKIEISYSIKNGSDPTVTKTSTLSLASNIGISEFEMGKYYILTLKIGATQAPIEFSTSVEDLGSGWSKIIEL